MNEYPSKIVGVLLHSVVESLDLFLIEKAEHPFLQLTAAFARDDLNQTSLLLDGLVDDGSKGAIDVFTTIVDIVQIQFYLHYRFLHRKRSVSDQRVSICSVVEPWRGPLSQVGGPGRDVKGDLGGRGLGHGGLISERRPPGDGF